MRIAVTGSSGFIGGRLVARATAAGHEVIAMGKDTWLDPLRPDVVIHAGWHGVRRDRDNADLQGANVVQTALSVRRAAEAKATLWIGLGSQAEYEARDAYGHAKQAALEAAVREGRAAGIAVTWARLFSVYGPHDPGPSLIHDLVADFRRKVTRVALTACEQAWDFLYEDDAADAVLALVAAPPGTYDVASGQRFPLKAAVLGLHSIMGCPSALDFGRDVGRSLPVANLGPLTRHTRWLPQVSLAAGLKRTAQEQP